MTSPSAFTVLHNKQTSVVKLSGRLESRGISDLWPRVTQEISSIQADDLVLDFKDVDYLDSAGAVFINHLEIYCQKQSFKTILVDHLENKFSLMVKSARNAAAINTSDQTQPPLGFTEKSGKRLSQQLKETKTFITHIGEITWALMNSLFHPQRIRWSDTFITLERAGVDALPIVALISFIVGLVMAFQAAIPMKMFGMELYVANLIGIAMVRELGPLMTAIVLAGRSASAFAAEIGTMRINEEIDALTVMGIDPVRFLIVPRVIAALLFTPLLAIFANLVGILGGALVIISFGYPIVSYYHQVIAFVGWMDFTGGMIKCVVFGILIAATGCICGYETGKGPAAVGISTTKAVVVSIILIAVCDAAFSIMFYYLGI